MYIFSKSRREGSPRDNKAFFLSSSTFLGGGLKNIREEERPEKWGKGGKERERFYDS